MKTFEHPRWWITVYKWLVEIPTTDIIGGLDMADKPCHQFVICLKICLEWILGMSPVFQCWQSTSKRRKTWYYDYLYTNVTSPWGVHQENPKSLFVIFPPFVFCILFDMIKQIWHACVVYTRNNFPERGLLLEGVAQGDCRPWATPSSDNNFSGM